MTDPVHPESAEPPVAPAVPDASSIVADLTANQPSGPDEALVLSPAQWLALRSIAMTYVEVAHTADIGTDAQINERLALAAKVIEVTHDA